MSKHTNPDDHAWEMAMSQEFDARVRDLREAPFDLNTVKGKAMTIRRRRRIAVAGGIVAVVAVIAPVAALATDVADLGRNEPAPAQTPTKEPSQTDEPSPDRTETVPLDPAEQADFIRDGVWYQADGDKIKLPANDYDNAVIWNDQLVATRLGGEVFAEADIVAPDGTVVDTFDTTGPVGVNDAHTTIAYIDPESGGLMTRWDGGEVQMATLDLSAPGEVVAYSVAAIVGGPDCHEEADGCMVYVNSNLGEPPTAYDSHGLDENPVPDAVKYHDADEANQVTVLDEIADTETCGGLYDLEAGDYVWNGCDFQAQQISPGGKYVAGLPSYFDGLGPREISILDAESGEEIGRYAPESQEGWIGQWIWLDDSHLAFTAYDGKRWQVLHLTPDNEIGELTEPVGGAFDTDPFVLVRNAT